MKLSFELHQLLVSGRGNTPDVKFPGGTADYITIHMTGNRAAGADAAAHANWMYTNAPYSWHVTVDDHEAWQSIPWDMQGWHAGDGGGEGNRESIGIEICMNAGIDQEMAYSNAAELVAWLLLQGHGAKGVVQHNHWTGKNCPELIRAEQGRWETFIGDVQLILLEEERREEEEPEMTEQQVKEMIDAALAHQFPPLLAASVTGGFTDPAAQPFIQTFLDAIQPLDGSATNYEGIGLQLVKAGQAIQMLGRGVV